MLDEQEMIALSSPQLRLQAASYFCSKFIESCGPPRDSYFKMVCYFDAFLFTLASVEEMVDETCKAKLRDSDSFRFVKALRNITAHHSVLASSQPDSKFARPFVRHIFERLGGPPKSSGNLALNYELFQTIFDVIEAERPREKYTLDPARIYLAALALKPQPVFLEQVLHDSLADVQAIVA